MDCNNCDKDFCDCFKKRSKEIRDYNVSKCENFLYENNIQYKNTSTPNVAKITVGDNDVYFSLKMQGYNIKCKINGKWDTIPKWEFLKLVTRTSDGTFRVKPKTTNMAKIVAVSIDLTKIDKNKVKTVTRQNGDVAKFYDLEFVVNDETDKFGNDAAVRTRLSKDEREAGDKPVYLGNGKTVWSSEAKPLPQTSAPAAETETNEDGLPF